MNRTRGATPIAYMLLVVLLVLIGVAAAQATQGQAAAATTTPVTETPVPIRHLEADDYGLFWLEFDDYKVLCVTAFGGLSCDWAGYHADQETATRLSELDAETLGRLVEEIRQSEN